MNAGTEDSDAEEMSGEMETGRRREMYERKTREREV